MWKQEERQQDRLGAAKLSHCYGRCDSILAHEHPCVHSNQVVKVEVRQEGAGVVVAEVAST